jgi:hypothetical protein
MTLSILIGVYPDGDTPSLASQINTLMNLSVGWVIIVEFEFDHHFTSLVIEEIHHKTYAFFLRYDKATGTRSTVIYTEGYDLLFVVELIDLSNLLRPGKEETIVMTMSRLYKIRM